MQIENVDDVMSDPIPCLTASISESITVTICLIRVRCVRTIICVEYDYDNGVINVKQYNLQGQM